jgi:hypothetical protein
VKRLGFSERFYPLVVTGRKTVTRRCHTKLRYQVGEVVAITCPHWRRQNPHWGHTELWDAITEVVRTPGGTRTTRSATAIRPVDGWHRLPAHRMPVWAARHHAEIVAADMVLLRAISDGDARREGVGPCISQQCPCHLGWPEEPHVCSFAQAWDELNAHRDDGIWAWDQSPTVVRYELRLTEV